VVFEHDVRFQFSCLNRFIYVKPVPDVSAVLQGVDEIHGKVSTVGMAARRSKRRELALVFCALGRDADLSARPDAESAADVAARRPALRLGRLLKREAPGRMLNYENGITKNVSV
jgi:hypothetical protein